MMIVKMTADHTPQVAQLEATCFGDPWSLRSINSELTNPLSLWLVALENDRVIGYVGSQAVMDEADMMNLAVDEGSRRCGVGEALVKALVDELAATGVTSLSLEVRVSNEGAIRLYEKNGFIQVGRRPNYYRNPREDAFILRKEWQR